MENKTVTKGNLFLLELIIVILFFAFAGAISLQVFAKADTLKHNAINLNHAMMLVQSQAEEMKSTTEPSQLGQWKKEVYFDENWQTSTSNETNYFTLETSTRLGPQGQGMMANILLTVLDNEDKEIFTITVKKYYPGGQTT